MSNPAVGALYKRIMDQVIEISRTDFEENGVDNRMVATLQEKWQKHLTSKRSASFPWDPATQAESQSEPTAPPGKAQSSASTNAPPAASRLPPTGNATSPVTSHPQSGQTSPSSVKQEAVNVKQEPGYDAAFSNYPAANNASYSSNPDVAAQRAQHLVQARYQQNQAQQQQGMNLGNIQLPGQQAAQQRPPYNQQQQRQGQLDGAGDDSGGDDINSDLDDSDDDSGDAMVGEDYQGDMIICLYDKVQRVKNKWKCTLKDGVASIGGKDYVFHRANGEYEW